MSTQTQKYHKVNMYLTRSLIDELHTISKQTGVPQAELVRRALKASFTEYWEQQKWMQKRRKD